jgi:hypothetical protein
MQIIKGRDHLKILIVLFANLADIKGQYGVMSFGQDHLSFRKRKKTMEAQMEQREPRVDPLKLVTFRLDTQAPQAKLNENNCH